VDSNLQLPLYRMLVKSNVKTSKKAKAVKYSNVFPERWTWYVAAFAIVKAEVKLGFEHISNLAHLVCVESNSFNTAVQIYGLRLKCLL